MNLPENAPPYCLVCGKATGGPPYRFFLGRDANQHGGVRSSLGVDFRVERELSVCLCSSCTHHAFLRDIMGGIGENLGAVGCLIFTVLCILPYVLSWFVMFLQIDIPSFDFAATLLQAIKGLRTLAESIFAFVLAALHNEYGPTGQWLALGTLLIAAGLSLYFLFGLARELVNWFPTPENLRAAGRRRALKMLSAQYAKQGYLVQEEPYSPPTSSRGGWR